MFMPMIVGSASPVITYINKLTDATAKTTYTFTGAFGTESTNRLIVVCIASSGNANTTVSSATIGGVAATLAVNTNNTSSGSSLCCIAYAVVPTNTSQSISITLGSSKNYMSISYYSVTGVSNTTHLSAVSSNGSGTSLSVTTVNSQANGVLIAATQAHDNPVSTTWTAGLTEDTDGVYSSVSILSSARLLATSTENPKTVTATYAASATSAVLGVVTWI